MNDMTNTASGATVQPIIDRIQTAACNIQIKSGQAETLANLAGGIVGTPIDEITLPDLNNLANLTDIALGISREIFALGENICTLTDEIGRVAPRRRRCIKATDCVALWNHTLAAERAAFAIWDAIDEVADPDGFATAETKWNDLESALMAIPAPNAAACLEKLSRLHPPRDDGRTTSSYTWEYAGQTILDVRRLLGGDA